MRQRLGQHFLKNRAAGRAIVEALALAKNDTVIEIGPGHGELTQELLTANGKWQIVGIEKDPHLAAALAQKYAGDKRIEIISGDALKILPVITRPFTLPPKADQPLAENLIPYKLVGNIPYYITGHLLRIVGELESKPALTVFTIQKEVALRICAVPPRMNLLAASVQIWAEPKILQILKSRDFAPPPKVDSAILKLTARDNKLKPKAAQTYFETARILFRQPRKTILNNLRFGEKYTEDEATSILIKADINPKSRPQNLNIDDIQRISRILCKGPAQNA